MLLRVFIAQRGQICGTTLLRDDNLENDGALALISGLQQLANLSYIGVENNNINSNTCITLRDAVYKNSPNVEVDCS
jgi:hypothetical protein